MTKGRQQPVFQADDPYREYSQRHLNIRTSTNRSLLLVLVPSLLYMTIGKEIFLLIGAAYLAAVFWTDRRQRQQLMDEYTRMEQQRLGELEAALTALGIPENRRYTFGYCRREDGFDPVLLCRSGETVYRLENVFVKNCIYGADGQMLYLFDLDREALAQPPRQYQIRELAWEAIPESHQDLLRQEGLRLDRFLVVESFIYAAVLAEMKTGRRKQFLHTTYCLTKMRKEKVYRAALPNGEALLLPQPEAEILGLAGGSGEKAGGL